MPTRKKPGTGVSVWILCSPQRGEQPLPVGAANAASIKRFSERLISSELVLHLKMPFIGVEADVGITGDWQVQIEFSPPWSILLQHVKKNTFCRKIKKIKFHIGDNAFAYKPSECIVLCYPVTERESTVFIFTFFWGLNSGSWNVWQPEPNLIWTYF